MYGPSLDEIGGLRDQKERLVKELGRPSTLNLRSEGEAGEIVRWAS